MTDPDGQPTPGSTPGAQPPATPPGTPPGIVAAAPIEPLDVDGVRAAAVGTVVWALAFLVLLPFSGRLGDDDRLWWLWTCAAGVVLGLIALAYTRRRRSRLRARA